MKPDDVWWHLSMYSSPVRQTPKSPVGTPRSSWLKSAMNTADCPKFLWKSYSQNGTLWKNENPRHFWIVPKTLGIRLSGYLLPYDPWISKVGKSSKLQHEKNNLRKHNRQGSTMGERKGLQSYPATILEPFSEYPGGDSRYLVVEGMQKHGIPFMYILCMINYTNHILYAYTP